MLNGGEDSFEIRPDRGQQRFHCADELENRIIRLRETEIIGGEIEDRVADILRGRHYRCASEHSGLRRSGRQLIPRFSHVLLYRNPCGIAGQESGELVMALLQAKHNPNKFDIHRGPLGAQQLTDVLTRLILREAKLSALLLTRGNQGANDAGGAHEAGDRAGKPLGAHLTYTSISGAAVPVQAKHSTSPVLGGDMRFEKAKVTNTEIPGKPIETIPAWTDHSEVAEKPKLIKWKEALRPTVTGLEKKVKESKEELESLKQKHVLLEESYNRSIDKSEILSKRAAAAWRRYTLLEQEIDSLSAAGDPDPSRGKDLAARLEKASKALKKILAEERENFAELRRCAKELREIATEYRQAYEAVVQSLERTQKSISRLSDKMASPDKEEALFTGVADR
jgi:hypothetical protein